MKHIAAVAVLALLPGMLPASAEKTITIDFGDERGAMEPKIGMLLMPNFDVPEGRFTPLKVRYLRDGQIAEGFMPEEHNPRDFVWPMEDSIPERVALVSRRLKGMGIGFYELILFLPSWVNPKASLAAPRDYDLWKQWVKDLAQHSKDAGIEVAYWDIWNEGWGINNDHYKKMYSYAWEGIKEVLPNAKLVGPGLVGASSSGDFLIDHCAARGLTLEAYSWHFPSPPGVILKDLKYLRRRADANPSIGLKDISVEEYFFHNVIQRDGLLVNYFTAFEEAGVDIAIKAIWTHSSDGQSLSDLMGIDNHRPNPCPRNDAWWVFKAYAELSGTRVGVARPDDATTAIAAKHAKTGDAKILLGHSGRDAVTLNLALKNQPFFGAPVRVDKYRVVRTENDGLQFQGSATPRSTRDLRTRITMVPEDVWLVVVKKQASAPGSFCLKAPDDGVIALPEPTFTWTPATGASTYTVRVSETGDFSDPVVEAAGIEGTRCTLTRPLTEGKLYYWTVTASNAHGSTPAAHRMKYTFRVGSNTKVPGRFSLQVPVDGNNGISTTPRFYWTRAYAADSYTLVIDDDRDFSSPERTQSGIVVRTYEYYTLPAPLANDTTYYYKVYAVNAHGSRLMNGPVFRFTTRPAGKNPGRFSLVSPRAGAADVARRATFDWTDSNGATFYTLEIDDNPDFSSPEIKRTHISHSAHTINPDLLDANIRYSWRVKAHDRKHTHSTDASNNAFRFTTENKPFSPLLKAVRGYDGKAILWFQTVNEATGYTVKYGTTPGVYTGALKGVRSSPCVVTGLATGRTYCFAVVATNGDDESSVFNEKRATCKGDTHRVAGARDDFSYRDGQLAGKGSGAEPGWAGAWRNSRGAGGVVSGGRIRVGGNSRVHRDLDAPIGGLIDAGITYTISVDLALSREWTAFEAHSGGDRDANRVIALAAYGNQKLGIGSAMIDFDDVTGVKTFLIKIRFGASPADQDTAELFINGVSQGAAVDIGAGFTFDRVGFASFLGPTLRHADNLAIALESLETCPHKILFETHRDDNWELYVMNANGSDPVNLTRTAHIDELCPRASPDGKRICFVAEEGKGKSRARHAYYMNLDGTGRKKIANRGRQPCWSPDGATIAFMKGKYINYREGGGANTGLYFYDLRTRKTRQHTNKRIGGLLNPCWTPDGKWIIASAMGGLGFYHSIVAIEVNGNRVVELRSSKHPVWQCRPDVSLDGKHIAWAKEHEGDKMWIEVGDLDMESPTPRVTNLRRVVAVPFPMEVYHADWSPDARYLAFSRGSRPSGRMGRAAYVVGRRAKGWNICVVDTKNPGTFTMLTTDGRSNKEPDWVFVPCPEK